MVIECVRRPCITCGPVFFSFVTFRIIMENWDFCLEISLKNHWKFLRIVCENPVWPVACSEGNHQSKVLTLLIIDRFSPLKVQIPIIFSSDNYYSDCIVIAKTFIKLAGGTMALIIMAECSYWLCKIKNKHNSLWSIQTRQDKPLSKHSGVTHLLVYQVVYRGCRDVDSNS